MLSDTTRQYDLVDGPPWNIVGGDGPVMTTAIHAGHYIRKELQPWLASTAEERMREEDPLTDHLLTVGDTVVRANRSRFEMDLNRSRELAVTKDPKKTWGVKIWQEDLPEELMESSRQQHDAFRAEIRENIDRMIAQHGRILVLDLHSYNHMRDGTDGEPAPQPDNPDIDVGVTELDHDLYGELMESFTNTLRSVPLLGETPDVRHNKRFPDGGDFPEWVHREWPERACVITIEYKKIFMDEWGHSANILALQDLRRGLLLAVASARQSLQALAR